MSKQPNTGLSGNKDACATGLATDSGTNAAPNSPDVPGACAARVRADGARRNTARGEKVVAPATRASSADRGADTRDGGPAIGKRPRLACEPSLRDSKSESEFDLDAKQIRQWASEGALIGTIASRLGVTKNNLRKAFRANPELELAYESGRAEIEQELFDTLRASARKGQSVPALFALKSQFGWTENPPPPPAQVGVQIVLPAPRTPEDYAKVVDGIAMKQIEEPKSDAAD